MRILLIWDPMMFSFNKSPSLIIFIIMFNGFTGCLEHALKKIIHSNTHGISIENYAVLCIQTFQKADFLIFTPM